MLPTVQGLFPESRINYVCQGTDISTVRGRKMNKGRMTVLWPKGEFSPVSRGWTAE